MTHGLVDRPSLSFNAARRRPAAPAPTKDSNPASDGFIYSGNRHESVPRALFLDRRLTPLERNTWQIVRMMLSDDGVTAFPTYDQLRPYLASTPCAEQASYETVARALTLLRLTRWLSLVRRRRDPKTGRIKGNLYVLHDEPLTPLKPCSSIQNISGLSATRSPMPARPSSASATTPSMNSPKTPCSAAGHCRRASRYWHSVWRTTACLTMNVIHRGNLATNPKKVQKPFFGMVNRLLRIPK